MVIVRFITGVVALAALILASQSVYMFMLAFKRWAPARRRLFLAISATIGLLCFVLSRAPSTAEDWVNQLLAIGLTLYLVPCLAIWMNRDFDTRPKPSWLQRLIVFLISEAFFVSALVMKIALTRARLDLEIDFAVLAPFAFGILCGHGLSYSRMTQWASAAFTTQAYWWCNYILFFLYVGNMGSFAAIPYLAMMMMLFPAIMTLVLLGTWLGFRLSEILRLPETQRDWGRSLLCTRFWT